MDRVACVDVRGLPLQLLVRREGPAGWSRHPVAVVSHEGPQGEVLLVDERAWERGVRPGMRLSAALSLARELRAGVVERDEIRAAIGELTEQLRTFSPDVEPCQEQPGVFWLNATGLTRLAPSLGQWARRLRERLAADGLSVAVAIAFTRFGAWAAARSSRSIVVFPRPVDEQTASHAARLEHLGLDPRTLDALAQLGVHTVRDLLRLPPNGVRRRFGAEIHHVYRLARGDLEVPLEPQPEVERVRQSLGFEPPETDRTRLVFLIHRELPELLEQLAAAQQSARALHLRLQDEDGKLFADHAICPAEPTRDRAILIDLVRLRLETLDLQANGIGELEIELEGVSERRQQLQLELLGPPPRDRRAANRALARVRAEHGAGSVARAVLCDDHLPERSYAWLEYDGIPELTDEPAESPTPPPLIRRHRRDAVDFAWQPLAPPHRLSGRWWDQAADREYHYAATEDGRIAWLCHDRTKRSWVQQGTIE